MRKFFVTTILTLLPLAVFAQVTTASIAGTVTDSNNTPIIGATVVAANTATGVSYGTSANIDGKYHLDGLKVGGEYVVTFSCVGYITSAIEKIYPSLGQTLELNTTLKDQPSIDSIVVVGDYKPQGNFSANDIAAMPTVTRSIYDIARLSPYAATQQEGGVAIGGANSRYNSFYIDGIVNNDMYGLLKNSAKTFCLFIFGFSSSDSLSSSDSVFSSVSFSSVLISSSVFAPFSSSAVPFETFSGFLISMVMLSLSKFSSIKLKQWEQNLFPASFSFPHCGHFFLSFSKDTLTPSTI